MAKPHQRNSMGLVADGVLNLGLGNTFLGMNAISPRQTLMGFLDLAKKLSGKSRWRVLAMHRP
jgi:hypothetical protein